jgi:outer membrane protein, heavy metal efflux system
VLATKWAVLANFHLDAIASWGEGLCAVLVSFMECVTASSPARPKQLRAGAMVLLGWAAVLAGCAHFESKPLSPSLTADAFGQRSLTDAGLKSYLETNGVAAAWPLAAWDLRALTLAAFYYHPDLDVARAKWALAKAGKLTAAERPNPDLSVAPGYNTTTAIPSPWLVTPTLDIPIETAGKRGYRIAEATHLSEAARLNIAAVAWQVRSRVRRSLLDLYAAGELEALLKAQQALQSENVRLLEQQQAAGAISAFELTQARLAADSTRLALHDAERQRAEARLQLADSLGVPATALEGVQFSFATLVELPGEVPAAEARRRALLNRADILGALAEYAASQSALQLEIAKQYPDVHLSPGYEFDQGDSKWSLGLSVTLPVFNQNQGAIAEAQARRTEAAASFVALQARVVGEIERAVAGYRLALQKKADTDAMRANLQKQEKTAQAMLDAGEISRSELAAQRLQLSASALARLEALTKSQQALGQLEDALQSPLGLPATFWQNSPRLSETAK